jgi:hypothetical protein
MNNIVNFKQWQCEAIPTQYGAGQNALRLFDTLDGSLILVASVCLPDSEQDSDEIFIKSWSENQGVRKALVQAGIIGPKLESIPVGFTMATRHKLLIKTLQE